MKGGLVYLVRLVGFILAPGALVALCDSLRELRP
jgi:hypothetical protein